MEIVIPDHNIRAKLLGNDDIFEPGKNIFAEYLVDQYTRINSNQNLRLSASYFAVELQQSLQFIGIGHNRAFRNYLDHDDRVSNAILPNRLRQELEEILHNITDDYVELINLKNLLS